MSEWTKIRDGALDALKDGALNVVEETKQEFLKNFIESGIPVVEEYAEKFLDEVTAQAKEESGWCKIRDAVVIPFAVKVTLYVGKQVIALVANKTETEAG